MKIFYNMSIIIDDLFTEIKYIPYNLTNLFSLPLSNTMAEAKELEYKKLLLETNLTKLEAFEEMIQKTKNSVKDNIEKLEHGKGEEVSESEDIQAIVVLSSLAAAYQVR